MLSISDPSYQKYAVRVARSRIDGFGVFAAEPIPPRLKIGEIRGESVTIAEARRMTAAANARGIFLAVHENFRFQQPLLKIAETIKTGAIGTPTWARISFRTGYDIYTGQPYLAKEERFVLIDLGVHVLDVARVFLGEVEQVLLGKNGKPLLYSEGQYAKLASLTLGEPLPEGLDYWGF